MAGRCRGDEAIPLRAILDELRFHLLPGAGDCLHAVARLVSFLDHSLRPPSLLPLAHSGQCRSITSPPARDNASVPPKHHSRGGYLPPRLPAVLRRVSAAARDLRRKKHARRRQIPEQAPRVVASRRTQLWRRCASLPRTSPLAHELKA